MQRFRQLALVVWVLLTGLYALPNLYGEQPALSLQRVDHQPLPPALVKAINQHLQATHLPFISDPLTGNGTTWVLRFANTEQQMKARDSIQRAFSKRITTTLNLLPKTPRWLRAIGATPMKLGLDLRGGIHMLLQVDTRLLQHSQILNDRRDVVRALRHDHVPFSALHIKARYLYVNFPSKTAARRGLTTLVQHMPSYVWEDGAHTTGNLLQGHLRKAQREARDRHAVEQAITTLEKRINELGVSEAVIQRQGLNHISVDLPGIQDMAKAKAMLGKTATLRFHVVALPGQTSSPPPLRRQTRDHRTVLLEAHPALTGASITYATATMRDGQPAVNIQLGGGGEQWFHDVTGRHIGSPMAILYIETQTRRVHDGQQWKNVLDHRETVISTPIIQSALGNQFDITGLASLEEAQDLALYLRSGALAAPISIVEELTVGPSLGAQHVREGINALLLGSGLVILFMAWYYRGFGWIANAALVLNVWMIMACLSWIGATLTLPGIAGIVLTVGMAVDANVLINERIREELRLGLAASSAIDAGYQRAFSTIVDANVTTLIVAAVLFGLGSGSVKGFAVTLTIGILSSMLTSVTFTRTMVRWFYPPGRTYTLSIGQPHGPS